MNKRLFLVALAMILNIQLSAQVIDMANNVPPVEASHGLQPLRASSGEARILWDTSNGVYGTYSPEGLYSSLAGLLAARNQHVESSSAGVLNLDLHSYDVLVICTLSSYYGEYSQEEADRIESYVAQGGTLLMVTEHFLITGANIFPITASFGVRVRDFAGPVDALVTDIRPLPMMSGIETLQFNGVSELFLSAPMEVAAAAPTGEAVIGAGSFGAGRVVIIADCHIFDNGSIGQVDNQLLAENVFDYLTAPTVPLLSEAGQWVMFLLLLVTGTVMVARSRKQ